MNAVEPLPVVLTIAGSDSGGGAGIQADLKTITALGCHGTTAITCVTAQNPDAVTGVSPVSVDMVRRQIDAVCQGFPVAAAKTGMLYSAEIINAVSGVVRERAIANLVVDPVMVATSGARLLRDDAVEALCSGLLPQATVITPNIPEAEVLCGHEIASRDALVSAALEISQRFGTACALKGGHLADRDSEVVVDVLAEGGATHVFTSPRVHARETHGTGCTFAAALAALLARGMPLVAAVKGAQSVVVGALRNASQAGEHYPLAPGPFEKCLFVIGLAVVFACSSARGALLSYEGFATGAGGYTAGANLPSQGYAGSGQASGGSWTGDDAADTTVSATGLKHWVVSSGGKAVHSGNGATDRAWTSN